MWKAKATASFKELFQHWPEETEEDYGKHRAGWPQKGGFETGVSQSLQIPGKGIATKQ
jgi:hypothetical protein